MIPDTQQAETIARLKEMPRAILRAPVGAGKTLIAAKVAEWWIKQGGRVLYVSTPTIAYQEAPRQFKGLIPDARVKTLDVGRYDRNLRAEKWYSGETDILFSSIQVADELLYPYIDEKTMIILDESTLAKRLKGVWQSRLQGASDRAGRTLIMSGTITSNGLDQVYGQAAVALGSDLLIKTLGYRAGWLKRHFNSYKEKIGLRRYITRYRPKVDAVKRVAEELAEYTIAIDTNEHYTPPPIHLEIHWTKRVSAPEFGFPSSIRNVPWKSQQINFGIVYIKGKPVFLHDHRIQPILDLIDELNRPVIYVTKYIHEMEEIKKRLKERGKRVKTHKDENWIDAWNNGKIDVLIVHPRSCGHGVNLQHGGNTMIWGMPTSDWEAWEQTVGRLARRGQKADHVDVHVFATKGSKDQTYINRLQERAAKESKFVIELKEAQ